MFASRSTRTKKLVTTILIVLSSVLGMQASFASYYPSGPQLNVPVSTVTSGGWTLCFEEDFGLIGRPISEMLQSCRGKDIMLAGKLIADEDIKVLAAGERSAVFQVQTVYNEKTLNNGTYFYFYPVRSISGNGGEWSRSIGFSRSNETYIYHCDYFEDLRLPTPDPEYRLCRHFDDNQVFGNSFRVGSHLPITATGIALFQVYQSGITAIPAPALRQTSNLSFDQSQHGSDTLSDPDGQLRKTLDSINAKYGNLIK